MFYPIHTANMEAIKAMGKGNILFKLELIKKIIELITVIITMFISVEAMVIGLAIITTLFTFINAYPNIKLINYSFKEQILDICPALLMSLIMYMIVYMVGQINLNINVSFILQICTGIIVYLILCLVTKNREFKYMVNFFKK